MCYTNTYITSNNITALYRDIIMSIKISHKKLMDLLEKDNKILKYVLFEFKGILDLVVPGDRKYLNRLVCGKDTRKYN